MNQQLRLTILLASIAGLSGCATQSKMPTNMPDGQGTYRYEVNSRFAEYSGEWRNNSPYGKGTFKTNENVSCSGVFEQEGNGGGWCPANGEIYKDGQMVYHGQFANYYVGASVCRIDGVGTVLKKPWKITGDWDTWVFLKTDSECKIENDDGRSFAGICSAPVGSTDLEKIEGTDRIIIRSGNNVFGLASGQGVYTDKNGIQYQGPFNHSLVLSGLYHVTRPQLEPTLALYKNDQLIGEHPAPEVIAKHGKDCGLPGWVFTSGNCKAGVLSGAMEAYSADGLMHLRANFLKGEQSGDAQISKLGDEHRIAGKLAVPLNKKISFIKGSIFAGNDLIYQGEMSGIEPNGKGTCYVDGAPEACEFLSGQRIDALYKMRQENLKLMAAIDEQKKEAQRQANQQAQAAAAQQQSDQGGFQWGKLAALGTGALIGGVGKLSSGDQAKVLTGMVQDSMSGQQGMNHVNAVTGGTSSNAPGATTNPGNDAAACASQYNGPNNDPQFDSFCKLAAFDACLHRVTQQATYDAEGRNACKTLNGMLQSTGGAKTYSCSYCPFPY